ncbi:MAG: protein kinase [Planctomycetes bacterium]|nr:protein kinase [Planctomycetota bacterium]
MVDPAAQDDHDEASFFLDGLSQGPSPAERETVRALPAETEDFRFIRELGRGGMGVVYEAEDKAGDRRVAVKVIAADLRLSEQALQRFEREARAAAALGHRNCVFVYGAHRVQDSPAISMELMDETLEDRLRLGEPIPVELALRWTDEVLRGLEAAHAIDLIHRDVKPSNVFLDARGRAKVGDFGLTRKAEENLGLTRSGQFLGSPLYASPEQLRGRAVDGRSDIYSVGALLYALLSGQAPHPATNLGDLIARITTETPRPLTEFRPDLPLGLDQVVARALAREPEQRFADCAAFRRALLPFLGEGPRSASLAHRFAAMVLDFILLLAVDGLLGMLPGTWSDLLGIAVFLGYFGLLEGRGGCALGKYVLGLRVTSSSAAAPGILRAMARAAAFQLRLPLALLLGEGPGALVLQVWFLLLFVAARRRNGYRGLHEFATGTRVVSVARAHVAARRALLEHEKKPLVGERPGIGRFRVEAFIRATPGGELLLARDPRLDRPVWIHRFDDRGRTGAADLGELRRLEHLDLDGRQHDVYEDPGGSSLDHYRRAGATLDWPQAREAIVHLLDHGEGRIPALDRLWIDRDGHLRVLALDEGKVEGDFAEVMRALLGSAHPGDWPAEVPDEAASILRRLLRAREAGERRQLGRRLGEVTALAPGLGRLHRGLQIGLMALPFVVHLGDLVRRIDRASSAAETGHALLANGLFSMTVIVAPLVVLAYLLRGGLDFQLLRLRLVDEQGERAKAWQAAARAAMTYAPLALASLSGRALQAIGAGIESAMIVALLVPFTYLGLALVNFLRPEAGLQDSVLGTRIQRRPRAR